MKERVYSFIIDIIFISGLSFILGMILSLINLIFNFFDSSFYKGWPCILLSILLIWIYFACMESSKYQATLGKKILGLKVTNLKYRRITFFQATQRFIFKIFSFGIKLNNKGQALHDKFSNCLVIKE
ncbi:MAG: RDD family protein [Candidatus Nanoarchaeia archaeon]|nr:RDD family protein [Candidatus Nanoarchaeia archaeon]